jgi:hypothetical protein
MSALLAGFVRVEELAADVGKTSRTIHNWINQPDGLPFVQLGANRYVHLETAREWLMARMRQRNPDRRRRERKR